MARQRALRLTRRTVTELRASLPQVADRTVSAITEEVPSYSEAFTGSMGETIRGAVEVALGGFLSLAERSRGAEQSPTAGAADGAYQLGRGEARSGRSVDALLSAYRIGARVAWREMSTTAVGAGLDAENVGRFAELVFAYIDELSAASVAGHGDERETTGRVRQRLLERLADQLLVGADAEVVERAALEADWPVPETLTAVLVPDSQVRGVLGSLPAETLQVAEPAAGHGEEGMAVLLVPDVHERGRASLLRALEHRSAVAGPARAWTAVADSLERAARVRELGRGPDSEAHLAELVLSADPVALEDLRARVLAPFEPLRTGSAEKLLETLRSWLLHQGRRDAVAADLFVHAQTVRYRMTQVREVLGDRLDDPVAVLELTTALGTLDAQRWAENR